MPEGLSRMFSFLIKFISRVVKVYSFVVWRVEQTLINGEKKSIKSRLLLVIFFLRDGWGRRMISCENKRLSPSLPPQLNSPDIRKKTRERVNSCWFLISSSHPSFKTRWFDAIICVLVTDHSRIHSRQFLLSALHSFALSFQHSFARERNL